LSAVGIAPFFVSDPPVDLAQRRGRLLNHDATREAEQVETRRLIVHAFDSESSRVSPGSVSGCPPTGDP
jgi:hypothetical protein